MTRAARKPPLWPLLALILGWLLGGPAGLLVSGILTAAILLVWLRLQIAEPRLPDLPMLRARRPEPPLPGFSRTVGAVEWGLTSAYDFDHALRPRLQRVLGARLAERYRVDFARDPAAAREMIDPDLWPLLDPERPASHDRTSPGPSPQTLSRLLAAIERI